MFFAWVIGAIIYCFIIVLALTGLLFLAYPIAFFFAAIAKVFSPKFLTRGK
jgi:hypothetical protein